MKIIGVLSILLFCAILGYGKKSVSFLEPNCGLSISSGKATARIVGGEIADMYGNPWMAYIRHDSWCGGSLITNRFVLSAAHCITGYPATVYLGQFDMSRSTPNGIQVPVDAQIRHPHYSKPRGYKNDIALFQLARTVQYTDFIRPICLPTNFSPLDQTTHLTTTGWGKTENGVPSSVLKTTTLTQYDRRACSSRYNSNVDISQICAGSPSSSSCNGDSGGPITTVYPINGTDRVIQLGIVSYGDIYCRSLGVYTNVIHYMSWITSYVQNPPAPTQRPNNNNPTHNYHNNNNYYYTYPNYPYYYYPRNNYPSYYYSPTYYYPNVYYYPGSYTQNYGFYG